MSEGVVCERPHLLYLAAGPSDVTQSAPSWVESHCDANIPYSAFYHFPHIQDDVLFSSLHGVHVELL